MNEKYKEVLKSDESLEVFIRNLKQFDHDFCDLMCENRDFTLRLEVRGNKGKMIHCRISRDHFDKPESNNGKSTIGDA